MKNQKIIAILITTCFFLSNSILFAQEHAENIEHTEGVHHEYHKHHISTLNGATSNFLHKTTALTTGLDYEYRFSKLFGVGVVVETVFHHSMEFEFGVPFFIHPYKGVKIIVDELLVFEEKVSENTHSYPDTGENSTEKVVNFHFRIGAGYEYKIKNFTIGPEVDLDFGSSQSLIYAFSIGYGL